METKTSKAIRLYKEGKLKSSLKIFKGFNMRFSEQEIRTLEIAYEIETGFGSFFSELGINTDIETLIFR